MTNENDSNSPATDPQRQPPHESPVPPPAPPQSEIREDSNHHPNNQETTARELAREFRWVEGAQLVVNAVLAVVGIVALVIYNGQLNVMRGQLGEISRQYPELHNSAEAAKDAAVAAKDGVRATQTAMRADQRAWVGIENITGSPSLNEVWKVVVVFHNSGRTPAKSILGYIVADPVKKGYEPNFSYSKDVFYRGGVIPPNGDYNGTVIPTRSISTKKPSPMIQPLLDAINNGDLRIYVHGQLEYDDIFGCRHWMTFCHFWHPETGGFGACAIHNDTGDNECRK